MREASEIFRLFSSRAVEQVFIMRDKGALLRGVLLVKFGPVFSELVEIGFLFVFLLTFSGKISCFFR